MADRPLMECGHTANAKDSTGKHVCAICIGINPGAVLPVRDECLPDLEGRQAKCCYCKTQVKSSFRLPFFEYQAKAELDRYYCGCFGWD